MLLLTLAATPALANDTIWAGLFRYQLQMAQLGNAEAQFKLAEHYEQGLGVEQDMEQAKEWYEKASRQGYEPATGKLKSLGTGRVQAPATSQVDPAAAQLEREYKARQQAEQELARIQAERVQVEQELARQREALQRLKAEKEREKAAAPVQKIPTHAAVQSGAQSAPVEDTAVRQRQREEAIEKAEAEYRKAMQRRVAKERLEMEMMRLQSTPIGYDN